MVLTRFDGTSWKEPVRVDAAAILDDAPVLCAAEDGTVRLAYSRAASDPGDSLLDYAQGREIVVGRVVRDVDVRAGGAVGVGDEEVVVPISHSCLP